MRHFLRSPRSVSLLADRVVPPTPEGRLVAPARSSQRDPDQRQLFFPVNDSCFSRFRLHPTLERLICSKDPGSQGRIGHRAGPSEPHSARSSPSERLLR
jgi:hypothetical protein